MRFSWRVIGAFAAIWIVAATVIFWTRSVRPTPATVAAYIDKNSLTDLAPEARAEVINHVAEQLNKLNFDERQDLRKTQADRRLFKQMTEEERKRFLDLTLPEGFRQLMLALNKMEPSRRQKFVQRALDDLEKDQPGAGERLNQEEVRKMLSKGMESFYSEANADVKMDFAPVIERLQQATQNMR